ncbi:hypothetical protein ACXX84_02720 [Mycoplasma sp. AC157]|uniref:hypothetical protein n=1 Tax=Mycoplasma sp. 480 TaxID=3440155 RepID=UPI003F515EB6
MNETNRKVFLTFYQQVQRLKKEKKMQIEDETAAEEYLKSNNYIQFITPYKIAFAKKTEDFNLNEWKENLSINKISKNNIFKQLFINSKMKKHIYYEDFSFNLLKEINENNKKISILLFKKILEIEGKLKSQISNYIAMCMKIYKDEKKLKVDENWKIFLQNYKPKENFEFIISENERKKIYFKYHTKTNKFLYFIDGKNEIYELNYKCLNNNICINNILHKLNLQKKEKKNLLYKLQQKAFEIKEFKFLMEKIKKYKDCNYIWRDIEKFELGTLISLFKIVSEFGKNNNFINLIFPKNWSMAKITAFFNFLQKLRNHIAHQKNLQYFYLLELEDEFLKNFKKINKIIFYSDLKYLLKIKNLFGLPYRFDIFITKNGLQTTFNSLFDKKIKQILNFL